LARGMDKCISSGKPITNDGSSVNFPCPGCGYKICRSTHARKIGAKYTCPSCGFEGPN